MGTLKNSYNFGTDEDTYKLYAPNRGFSGSANLMVSYKLTPDQSLLPWQPIVAMKRKISYNSACIEDTPPIIAPTRGFSGTANLTVQLKFVLDQPLLPWQRKFENFNRKIGYNWASMGDMFLILVPNRGFSMAANPMVSFALAPD